MKNVLLVLLSFLSFGYLLGYSIGSIPGGENMNGAFTKFMQTFYLKTGENLSISGNLSIANGQICVNGICHGDAEGTKTCRINQTDIKGKGCPKGSYLSHIGNTHGYCRYLNNYSAEADYIQSNEDACQWDTTFLALMYNGTPPYITNVEGNVLINTGGTTISASQYDELLSGSIIETAANSFATIVFGDNSVIRLNENTKVVLVYDVSNTTARLEEGELWARVLRPFTQGSAFTVETGDLSAGVRGTSVYAKKTSTGSIFGVFGTSNPKEAPTLYNKHTLQKDIILPKTLQEINGAGGVVKKDITKTIPSQNNFINYASIQDILYMSGVQSLSGTQVIQKNKIAKELSDILEEIHQSGESYIKDNVLARYIPSNSLLNNNILEFIYRDYALRLIKTFPGLSTTDRIKLIATIRKRDDTTYLLIINEYIKQSILQKNPTKYPQQYGQIITNILGGLSGYTFTGGNFYLGDTQSGCSSGDLGTLWDNHCVGRIEFDGNGKYRIKSIDIHEGMFAGSVNNEKFTSYPGQEDGLSNWYPITEEIPMTNLACTFGGHCNSCIQTKLDGNGNITIIRGFIEGLPNGAVIGPEMMTQYREITGSKLCSSNSNFVSYTINIDNN